MRCRPNGYPFWFIQKTSPSHIARQNDPFHRAIWPILRGEMADIEG